MSEVHFFVVFLFTIFCTTFSLEKNTYFPGFSWENLPKTHPFSGWVCMSLGGECSPDGAMWWLTPGPNALHSSHPMFLLHYTFFLRRLKLHGQKRRKR